MTTRKFLYVVVTIAFLFLAFVSLKLLKSYETRDWIRKEIRYALSSNDQKPDHVNPTHIFFTLADHWEPGSGPKNQLIAINWLKTFQNISDNHRDSTGRRFQYTWFYPIDNFDDVIIKELVESSKSGYGDIEVHWHHSHRDKTETQYLADLDAGLAKFDAAGALSRNEDGSLNFVFIHGNWALDNSKPKGVHCGVDNEISILESRGAIADMTFPSAAGVLQPAIRAKVFFTDDTPNPRSFDNGRPAQLGIPDDGFLIVQGPLSIDLRDPLLLTEYGALDDARGTGFSGAILRPSSGEQYFADHRIGNWVKHGARIPGKEEWVFIKVHAHGVQHRDVLLNGQLDRALATLKEYATRNGIELRYVTAREMVNLITAITDGEIGKPEELYEFKYKRAPYR